MALLEAISLGTPAVVSPTVEQLIGVDAAGAGWVATEERLGPLLRGLDENQLERKRGAAVALSRRFDWDRIAGRYEAAYERAVGRR